MISLELIDHIKNGLKAGMSEEELHDALTKSGMFSEGDFIYALSKAKSELKPDAVPKIKPTVIAGTAPMTPAITDVDAGEILTGKDSSQYLNTLGNLAPQPKIKEHKKKVNSIITITLVVALLSVALMSFIFFALRNRPAEALPEGPPDTAAIEAFFSNEDSVRFELSLTGTSKVRTAHLDPFFAGSINPIAYTQLNTKAPVRDLEITTTFQSQGALSKSEKTVLETAGTYAMTSAITDSAGSTVFGGGDFAFATSGSYRSLDGELYFSSKELPSFSDIQTDLSPDVWFKTDTNKLSSLITTDSGLLLSPLSSIARAIENGTPFKAGVNTINGRTVDHIIVDTPDNFYYLRDIEIALVELWVEPDTKKLHRTIIRAVKEATPENPDGHSYTLDVTFTQYGNLPSISAPDFFIELEDLIIERE